MSFLQKDAPLVFANTILIKYPVRRKNSLNTKINME